MEHKITKRQRGALRAVVLGSVMSCLCSTAVWGQEIDSEAEGETQDMGKVTVTGSHIKMIDAVSTAPIQIISRADIDRSGAATVSELLAKITANSGGSLPETFNNGFADGATGVSLRGMGVNRTLVLINNRRVASFAFGQNITDTFTDINAIALESVDRVEVLLDGASAVYGSDAITGVVNFILRNDYDGFQISAQTYNTSDGGADQQALNLMWGKVADKGSILVSIDYFDEDALEAYDRDIGTADNWSELDSRVDYDPRHAYGDVGQANYYHGYTDQFFGFGLPYPLYSAVGGEDACTSGDFRVSGSGNSLFCSFSDNFTLTPEKERVNVMINGTYTLGNIELAGDLQYNKSETDYNYFSAFNWIHTAANLWGANPDGSGVINNFAASDGWSWYATQGWGGDFAGATLPGSDEIQGVPIADVAWLMTDLGDQITTMESENIRIAGSAAGVFADVWDWELSGIYSKNEADIIDTNRPNTAALFGALNSYNYFYIAGMDLTPWGINVTETNSQETLNAIRRSTKDTGESEMKQLSFIVNNSSFSLPAGNVGLAFGVEYREEELKNTPDAQLVAGQIFNSGSRSVVKGDRDIWSVYAEAQIPVMDNLDLTLAVRTEDYSDFGQTTNPKIGLRWQLNDYFLMRANWGTGFRAPGMMEMYLDDAVAYSQYRDYTQCSQYDAGTGSGVNDGSEHDNYCWANYNQTNFSSNPDLDPEESESYSVGVVISPLDTMTIEIDYWDIEIDDVINNLHPSDMVYQESQDGSYSELIDRFAATDLERADGVTAGKLIAVNTSYYNLDTLKASGVDVKFDWTLNTRLGIFDFWATTTYQDELTSVSPFVGDDPWLGLNGYPRWRAQFGSQWSKDDWMVALQGYYRHDMLDYDSSQDVTVDGENLEIRSNTTYNLSVVYQGIDDLELTAQVINVTDEEPAFSTYPTGGLNMTDTVDGRAFRFTLRYKFF
ncbi:MAG: TonB-dependent receptor [Halieaceae bacterium]|jgi:iron complex outermembrane recepter protein|nr:TonB-dependent receptor [Halieaceae bacterium]